VPVQDIQPLSGQGLGTGTQTTVLQDAAQGNGALPTFIKWWEQTVSDRVLPATTELQFTDENDMRDQKLRAEVAKLRAETRAVQIQSGEISPAIARQLAVDSEDLPREMIADDATAGGAISDDEKALPETQQPINPALLALLQSEPTQPPKQAQPGQALKAYNRDWTEGINAAVQNGMITEAQADILMYGTTTKATDDESAALLEEELAWAKKLGRQARKQ